MAEIQDPKTKSLSSIDKNQRRAMFMQAISVAQLSKTNSLLELQTHIEGRTLQAISAIGQIGTANLAVNQQMLSQLESISGEMKTVADRAKKENLADELNATLLRIEKALDKLEEAKDSYGLILACASIDEQFKQRNITSSMFTQKNDMREFEALDERIQNVLGDSERVQDVLAFSAGSSAQPMLASAIRSSEERMTELIQNRDHANEQLSELNRLEEAAKRAEQPKGTVLTLLLFLGMLGGFILPPLGYLFLLWLPMKILIEVRKSKARRALRPDLESFVPLEKFNQSDAIKKLREIKPVIEQTIKKTSEEIDSLEAALATSREQLAVISETLGDLRDKYRGGAVLLP